MKLFNEEDYQGAIEKFEQVPPSSPRFQNAQRYLGIAKDEQRKVAEASRARERALKGPAQHAAPRKPQTSGYGLGVDVPACGPPHTMRAWSWRRNTASKNSKSENLRIPILRSTYSASSLWRKKTLMGVTAYLEGDYTVAISQLRECSKTQADNPHLYTFLAYSCAAKCLLAPHRDASLRRAALEAFGHLRRISPGYTTNTRFVSPSVLEFLNGS